jgi:hypothetical protein
MRITINEHVFREIAWVGMPYRILHTFRLGAHGQKQYDMQGWVPDCEGEIPPEHLVRMREHTRAAALRTKELRKAAKRFPIDFTVEQI